MIVSINGEIVDSNNAKISVFDRGFLFGDSIYETMITFNGQIFRKDLHFNRLQNSAKLLGLKFNLPLKTIQNYVTKSIRSSEHHDLKIRLIVTRGVGDVSLDASSSLKNNVVVMTWPKPENPKWWYTNGVSVVIADIRRTSPTSVDPNIKSGNYLNNVLAYQKASENKAFEAIMLNEQGLITEATTSNVWMIKDNVIITPPLAEGLLEGITRGRLIKLGLKAGFKIVEKAISPESFVQADECFLTSTSRFVVPIIKVDKYTVGRGAPGELTLQLLDILNKEVSDFRGKNPL